MPLKHGKSPCSKSPHFMTLVMIYHLIAFTCPICSWCFESISSYKFFLFFLLAATSICWVLGHRLITIPIVTTTTSSRTTTPSPGCRGAAATTSTPPHPGQQEAPPPTTTSSSSTASQATAHPETDTTSTQSDRPPKKVNLFALPTTDSYPWCCLQIISPLNQIFLSDLMIILLTQILTFWYEYSNHYLELKNINYTHIFVVEDVNHSVWMIRPMPIRIKYRFKCCI